MRLLSGQLLERLLFTVVVIGILLMLFGIFQTVNITLQLNDNPAQQIQDAGGEVEIGTVNEGRSLMSADLERRELTAQRGQTVFAGGIGLVLLGFGWMGMDLMNSRKRRKNDDNDPISTDAAPSSI
ncbi:MAG: hypothetical protein ACPG7F_04020 [Aggregatilineales bacterium]